VPILNYFYIVFFPKRNILWDSGSCVCLYFLKIKKIFFERELLRLQIYQILQKIEAIMDEGWTLVKI
jgi:hypothetical protein